MDDRSIALQSGYYMDTVGKSTCSDSVPFSTDSHSRVVEYVLLKDPSIHLRFLKSSIGVRLTKGKNLDFTRRYLDPNRVTYKVTSCYLRKSGNILNDTV